MTSPTGNVYLDAISWGGWRWINPSGPLVLKYYFSNDYSIWTTTEKNAFIAAFQSWANVANFTIQETTDINEANFIEHNLSDSDMRAVFNVGSNYVLFGVHETPEDGTDGQVNGYFNYQTYSWPSNGITYDTGGLVSGGFGYSIFIHELGHGLGLAHPHDDGGGSNQFPGVTYNDSNDFGDNNLNDGLYTIMSYNRGWELGQAPQANGVSDYGYNYGPAAFDIAIIQYLYGARTSFHGGNDTYTITDNGAWMCIWDTGGTDSITYAGSHNAIIDLRSATLDNTPHGGGYLSYIPNSGSNHYYGGFTIAADYTNVLANLNGETGVIIENATGGLGNDTLIGNNVGNILYGNFGLDNIQGGYGNDTIYGNQDNDVLYGNQDNDTIYGGQQADTIYGGQHNDTLFGNFGNDFLFGNNGDDWLYGGQDQDYLHGGQDSDHLYGNLGNDELWGGAGNDTIDGGDDYDTARFAGARSLYTVINNGGGSWSVIEISTGYTDTLINIERLGFDNVYVT